MRRFNITVERVETNIDRQNELSNYELMINYYQFKAFLLFTDASSCCFTGA